MTTEVEVNQTADPHYTKRKNIGIQIGSLLVTVLLLLFAAYWYYEVVIYEFLGGVMRILPVILVAQGLALFVVCMGYIYQTEEERDEMTEKHGSNYEFDTVTERAGLLRDALGFMSGMSYCVIIIAPFIISMFAVIFLEIVLYIIMYIIKRIWQREKRPEFSGILMLSYLKLIARLGNWVCYTPNGGLDLSKLAK